MLFSQLWHRMKTDEIKRELSLLTRSSAFCLPWNFFCFPLFFRCFLFQRFSFLFPFYNKNKTIEICARCVLLLDEIDIHVNMIEESKKKAGKAFGFRKHWKTGASFNLSLRIDSFSGHMLHDPLNIQTAIIYVGCYMCAYRSVFTVYNLF